MNLGKLPLTTAHPSTIFLWFHRYYGCAFRLIKAGYTVLDAAFPANASSPATAPRSDLSVFRYSYLCIYALAIARRLLTAIYQMLLKDEPYQPCALPAQESIPKQRVMTAEDALAMLRRKGYILVDADGAIIEGNVLPTPA